MRPLELRLRNFRSYFGESTVFDFRGRTLVGIVGPIGSGKSSLLDAIAFALYGKTPAGGSSTKALIHQRAADGGALLRFEVEGEIWEAVRSLRAKGQSQHALYRYDADTAEAEPVEKLTSEADVNDKIASLLGLDFEAFGRSVLLAQGRFAEFLSARPAERDSVLKGVFGHDRIDVMRDVAKQKSAATAAELGKVMVRTEQLDRVLERLAENRAALAVAEERLEALRKAEPAVADLDARLGAAEAELKAATTRLAELAKFESRLPDPLVTARLLDDAQTMSDRRVELATKLETARADVTAAEASVAAMRDGGENATLEEAARLVAAAEPLRRNAGEAARRFEAIVRRSTEAAERQTAAAAAVAEAQETVAACEQRLTAAEAGLRAAERAHHDAQHHDMAATLRAGLAPGAPCPVCEQDVEVIPPLSTSLADGTARALSEAKAERMAAEQARADAAAALSASTEALDAAAHRVEAAAAEQAEAGLARSQAADELATTNRRLEELLGEGDAEVLLEARKERFAALTEAVADARRKEESVRTRHDQAIRDEQGIGKELSALRVGLVEMGTRLGVAVDVPDDGPDTLRRSAEALRSAWSEAVAALEKQSASAERERVAVGEERRGLFDELEVDGSFAAALAAEHARAEHLGREVRRDADEAAAGDGLLAERDRLLAVAARYDRIASDLTDSRFVRFLLDEERQRLADLGSDHFQRLSAGRYRFSDDGTFAIVDLTAADAVRKASSLSGGETFLASLALALSLAEMVTRTGGRLDAFFLDEGFGALDPEHLDLAMEGIEALVADDSDRLVVVVSHVPEMRHRVEDLIQLDRDPSTGDTRVVRS